MSARKLSPKQEVFVQEYLKDLNATQAAIRAGYSEKSASRIGIELLNKNHSTLTEEQAAGVAEVAEGSGGALRLKKHDKVKALELLGKHIGMFRDRVETDVSGGVVLTWQK